MHPVRKKRLLLILAVVLGLSLAIGLLLYAMQENVNHFYTPSELNEKQSQIKDRTFRLGGMVQKGSIKHTNDVTVTFIIEDTVSEVTAEYSGILPDLFREGQGVVIEGKLNSNGKIIASQVLAKHDENYMPPQIQKKLDNVSRQATNKKSSD